VSRYAAVRVVRAVAGDPSVPDIASPPGYELLDRGAYAAATPGEYYTFIEGPEGVADLSLSWDAGVSAVVSGDERLDLAREGDRVSCSVPVVAASPDDCRHTMNVYTHVGTDALPVRVEHNHPERRAGHYADVPWVGAQARAALNLVFAAREAVEDWGVADRLHDDGRGTLRLMGFESNDPPHGDFPPHWHLNLGLPEPWEGSQIPHLYLDEAGRTTRNEVAVLGRPERSRTHGVRDPLELRDADGRVRVVVDVRPDGGVDLGPAPGEWRYSLVAGDGGFPGSVAVERRGEPWRAVAVRDDVRTGRLSVTVSGECERTETYEYDPLTGTPEG
jgi:hypothetical protein